MPCKALAHKSYIEAAVLKVEVTNTPSSSSTHVKVQFHLPPQWLNRFVNKFVEHIHGV